MRPPPRRRARWLASPPRSQRQRDPSSSFQHPFYCLRGGSVRAFDNPMIFHIFHKWRAPEYYWSSQKPKERCVHPRFQLSNGRGRTHRAVSLRRLYRQVADPRARRGHLHHLHICARMPCLRDGQFVKPGDQFAEIRDISNGGKRVQVRPLPRGRHGDEAEIGVISAPGAERHRLKHTSFRRSDATSDRSRPPGDGKVRQGMAVLARKDRLKSGRPHRLGGLRCRRPSIQETLDEGS